MTRTKNLIGHGNWLKWLSDNCPDISEDTARRWMRLSNNAHVHDLTDATSIRQAYIACGILPEHKPRESGIGTQNVDVFEQFVGQIIKLSDFDLSGLPVERKEEIRGKLREIEERL